MQGNQRTQKRDFKDGRDDTWTDYRDTRCTHDNVGERKNIDFDAYYQAQEICPEGEWDEFIRVLQSPLPITFRINGSGKFANDLRDRLTGDFLKGFASEGAVDKNGARAPFSLPPLTTKQPFSLPPLTTKQRFLLPPLTMKQRAFQTQVQCTAGQAWCAPSVAAGVMLAG